MEHIWIRHHKTYPLVITPGLLESPPLSSMIFPWFQTSPVRGFPSEPSVRHRPKYSMQIIRDHHPTQWWNKKTMTNTTHWIGLGNIYSWFPVKMFPLTNPLNISEITGATIRVIKDQLRPKNAAVRRTDGVQGTSIGHSREQLHVANAQGFTPLLDLMSWCSTGIKWHFLHRETDDFILYIVLIYLNRDNNYE